MSIAASATDGLFCAEQGSVNIEGENIIYCFKPNGTNGFSSPMGIAHFTSIPGGVKSIALFYNTMNSLTFLYVLGTDSILRRSYGDTSTFTSFVNSPTLHTFTVERQPVDIDTGVQLFLRKVVSIENATSPGHTLVALTTTGVAYTMANSASVNGWRKLTSAGIGFPSGTWRDVGHGAGGPFGYWVSSTQSIYRSHMPYGGSGWVGALPNGWLPLNIGGQYVITNNGANNPTCDMGTDVCNGDYGRFFNVQTWRNAAPAPFNQSGTAPGSAPPAPYWPKNDQIIAAQMFRGKQGEFFTHNTANRWYSWASPN